MNMKKSMFAQEFIGNEITVIKSSCKSQVGMHGKIIDETKNTLFIETTRGSKKFVKSQITFIIGNDGAIIDGKEISKKPEERLKLRI
jgi:ribonuclease P protein subunit POP4